MARSQVGREDYEQLTDKLDAAVTADFQKWREYEERLTQERPQVFAGSPTPKDVTTFILDHLLPQKMGSGRSNARGKKHKILNLVATLEPYQFVGLVLLYAIRIGDRDGVSRAFDILFDLQGSAV